MKTAKTALLTCVCLLAGSVLAGEGEDKIFPYDYKIKDLDNGLRIIVVPTSFPNIVSLQIPVQTGSRNEVEPGKSGFAHFFEHMMFRGTEKYPADVYGEILKNAGADQNAYTTDDYTNYHITFSKEDLEKVLELEADRFQNLKYSEDVFRTEAKAVLGEYNKNAANPIRKLLEVQRDAAFKEHTYKHTTMGFIQDIEDMPNQFDYSLTFFDRYYRPENTTVIVAGDVEPDNVIALVEKYWGDWKRGSYSATIPTEPEPDGPIYTHVDWESNTPPYLTVGFRGPAINETDLDMPALDVISSLIFSQSAPLYQKLVIEEQKVDQLFSYFPNRLDPYLVTAFLRIKDPADTWYVRNEVQKALAELRTTPVSQTKLDDIISSLKYGFANNMDSTNSIASSMAGFVAINRDPETINRIFALYNKVTPETIKTIANRYFHDKGMVVVTLSKDPLPEADSQTGSVDGIVKEMTANPPELNNVIIRNQSPLVSFRIQFMTGALEDPVGKEGLANLTAAMIADAGSKNMKYKDIQKAFFPIGGNFNAQVGKEMTTFSGQIHSDNLGNYYAIIIDQLLNPAFAEEDFTRVKTNIINSIKVALRGNNDEELGKEVLYQDIYKGHPYGHLTAGKVSVLEALTVEDVRNFYNRHYTRSRLVLGMAGKFSEDFENRVKHDLGKLPEGDFTARKPLPEPDKIDGLKVHIVEKDARGVAISMGFPIDVTRAHEDFPALWLARSYFGEHRSSNSYLYQRMREIRGMNYGDYAYIEYFPNGMFQFHPDPNLGRRQQIWQIWIRPVEPQNDHFALRIAKYELDKLIKEGISKEDFEATRNYLLKFVNVLTASQSRQLGYAMDSRYYDIPEFTTYIREGLQKLTHKQVNKVIKKHLQSKNMKIAIITKNAEDLKKRLVEDGSSPITYGSDKPEEIYAEDKVIQDYKLKLKESDIYITPVEDIFQ